MARRQRRSPGWPAEWNRYRRRWLGLSRSDLRLMVLAGIALGLGATYLGDGGGGAVGPVPRVPDSFLADPYGESRRSKEILERQEPAPPSALPEEPEARSGVVLASVEVIDGDTFRYRGETIRVADIDTPEMHGDCAYEVHLAARATERMEALLNAGPFELRPGGDGRDEDRYGRKLRVIVRDGRSVGDRLVAEGLARERTGRRRPWCA